MARGNPESMGGGVKKGRVATLGEPFFWGMTDKPLTGEGMFIIDQFQTTLEDGTLHMSDDESVSVISASLCHKDDR